MAAQGEVFELVVTAVDKAGPALSRVSGALDLVKQDTVALDAVMRQSAVNLRQGGTAMREAGANMQNFQTRVREAHPHLGRAHAESLKFATSVGEGVIRSLARLAGPILAAISSIQAFKQKLVDTKSLNDFARSVSIAPDVIKNIGRAGEAFGLESGKVRGMISDFSSGLQQMKYQQPGEFFLNLRQVQEADGLAAELLNTMRDVSLTDEERQQQALLKWQAFLVKYAKIHDEGSLRELLRRMGKPEEWAAYSRIPVDEFAKQIKSVGQVPLDPKQVEEFWKAQRELNRALSNFTTAVLTPLLPKLTELVNRLTDNKELINWATNTWPKICEDIEAIYTELKKGLEGNPVDWSKILGTASFKFFENDFLDFINQAKRLWKQFLAGTGIGSQADVDAARKEELQFRKGYKDLSPREEEELGGLEQGGSGAAGPSHLPRVNSEREAAILRRLQSHQKNQKSILDSDDSDRLTIENTRVLKDMMEEIKKLNMGRRPAPGGDDGAEGREHGGPVHGGQRYLVGEGHRPEMFVPRQAGGLVQPVGQGGPQFFTPAQAGAIVAPNLIGLRGLQQGGPAQSPINDLSPGAFHTRFKGGPLEGRYLDIVDAATRRNIPPSLMASIVATETGFGRNSRALRDYNNPAGLMAGGKGNRDFYKFNTLEEGLDKAAEVQRRVYTRGGETISGMGAIYAPPGAANDPKKTNALWPGLVSGIQRTLKDPGYDPGGLQDTVAPTVQTAGIAPPQLAGRQEGGPVLGWNVPSDERLKELMRSSNVSSTPFDLNAEMQQGSSMARFNFRLAPGWDAMMKNQQNIMRGAARIEDEREYKYHSQTGEPLALYRNPPTIGKLFNPGTGEQIGLGGSPLRSVYGKAKYGDDPLRFPTSQLMPGSLNATQNAGPGFEATGALNVNVHGPRGTVVKASGEGPFETVNMTRRMTEEPQLGAN